VDIDEFEISYCIVLKQTMGIIIKVTDYHFIKASGHCDSIISRIVGEISGTQWA
jgi:hypothetical protein